MRYTIIALASAASFASGQSSIPIGEVCTPNGTPCALGASCYATNSGLQTRCGNFQASCTRNEQCAFNTCNQTNNVCDGFLASTSGAAVSSAPTSTSSAQGFMPAPSPTIVAPAGSLPLGAECNPFVKPEQCAGGAQCWASNAGLIARCGNFNAACTTDAQCANTTCSGGLCRGFLSSSAISAAPSSAISARPSQASPPASSMPSNGTVSTRPTGTGSLTPTRSPTATTSGTSQFTGGASVENVAGGVMAIVLGAVAWVL